MSKLSAKKTIARRQALQVLYQSELTGASVTSILYSTDDEAVCDEDAVALLNTEMGAIEPFAISIIEGVGERMALIDEKLAGISENWTLNRMPIVDRNILRIATYEICFVEDVPTAVAINEAIELSKAFGTDETSKFVNGVLGRIAESFEKEE